MLLLWGLGNWMEMRGMRERKRKRTKKVRDLSERVRRTRAPWQKHSLFFFGSAPFFFSFSSAEQRWRNASVISQGETTTAARRFPRPYAPALVLFVKSSSVKTLLGTRRRCQEALSGDEVSVVGFDVVDAIDIAFLFVLPQGRINCCPAASHAEAPSRQVRRLVSFETIDIANRERVVGRVFFTLTSTSKKKSNRSHSLLSLPLSHPFFFHSLFFNNKTQDVRRIPLRRRRRKQQRQSLRRRRAERL